MATALVIDDSDTTRTIIRRILRELGFDVEEARDGQEGIDRLHAMGGKPEVVLVDWNMPRVDGLQFVESVRADHAYDDVPLMFVTTEVGMEHVRRALIAGANEYVMKPFTREMLLEKLALLHVDGN